MHTAYGMCWNSSDDANYYYYVRISSVHSAAVWGEKKTEEKCQQRTRFYWVLLSIAVLGCCMCTMQRAYWEKKSDCFTWKQMTKDDIAAERNLNDIFYCCCLQPLHRLCHVWLDFLQGGQRSFSFCNHPIKKRIITYICVCARLIEAQAGRRGGHNLHYFVICAWMSSADKTICRRLHSSPLMPCISFICRHVCVVRVSIHFLLFVMYAEFYVTAFEPNRWDGWVSNQKRVYFAFIISSFSSGKIIKNAVNSDRSNRPKMCSQSTWKFIQPSKQPARNENANKIARKSAAMKTCPTCRLCRLCQWLWLVNREIYFEKHYKYTCVAFGFCLVHHLMV